MAGLSSFKELQKETKRLDQKTQVTVFWDIENVRPVKNTSVLNFVSEVRSRYVVGGVEAGFIVVCDVRKEPKDLVDKLTEAQCQVQHVSGDKKNTSDEVLRQEMRRTVDMSSKPGRIVLISGDIDFSADLHSFRYRKAFEIILIHNNQAKEALLQCANTAISFTQLLGGARAKATQKQETKKEGKPKKETHQCIGKPNGTHDLQMIKYKKTNEDWYCSEHQNKSQRGPWPGQNYFKCSFCPRRLCQMCHSSSMQKSKKEKEKEKNQTKSKDQENGKRDISSIACSRKDLGHSLQMIKYKEKNDDWWCSSHQKSKNKGNWPGKIHYKCQFCPIKICEDCFEVKDKKNKKKSNPKAEKGKCEEVGCNMQLRKSNPNEKWRCGKKNCPLAKQTQGHQFYKCQWCDAQECELCFSDDSDSDSDDHECNMQLRKLDPNEKWRCGKKGCPLGKKNQGHQYYKCQWCEEIECEICFR